MSEYYDNPDEIDAPAEGDKPAAPKRERAQDRVQRTDSDAEVLALSGDKKQGSNRRKMAWLSLISMLVVTGLLLFVVDPARIEILSEPIVWFYMAMASVVGAYMGFTTYAYIRRNG